MLEDWRVNNGRPEIQVTLLLFRATKALRSRGRMLQLVAIPAAAAYRFVSRVLVGIDMPTRTEVGPRLQIHHGVGLVVHADTRIGADVTLRQSTTLGARRGGAAPILEDGVELGANVVIIGSRVGQGAVVGAGSVVVKDVPRNSVVAGNPASLLRHATE